MAQKLVAIGASLHFVDGAVGAPNEFGRVGFRVARCNRVIERDVVTMGIRKLTGKRRFAHLTRTRYENNTRVRQRRFRPA